MAALAGSSASDFSSKVLEACEAGDVFVKEFYGTIDKRRTLLGGFYSDSSFLVWNGNTHTGANDISTFYMSLPSSEHEVQSFDCQPIDDIQGQSQVLVTCEGLVQYDSQDCNSPKQFSQNFILVKLGEYWKISSDCMRFLDFL